MSQYAIETRQLTRTFGDVTAVDEISFAIPKGIVFGFLGPNGSGKTTTIRLLLGLLEPSGGSARVLGFDTLTQADEIRQRCGALLEDTGLYDRLNAEDNLEFYARIWRMPEAQRRKRIQQLLTNTGLWERRKDLVREWSRGMRQKLAVARALLHHPEMVFLDEPTAGLDPVASAALRDDLEKLVHQEGLTVFLTTHNLAEAESLCSQIAVINKGKLLAIGSPNELKQGRDHNRIIVSGRGFSAQAAEAVKLLPVVKAVDYRADRMVITLAEEAAPSAVVPLLVQAGAEIDEITRDRANLEEVFLSLVEEEKES